MGRYFINYGTGAENEYAATLEKAMEIAEKNCAYIQGSITIFDREENKEVALMPWCEPYEGFHGEWIKY